MCAGCALCVCRVWARAIPDDVRAWARSGWLAERLRVGRHVCGQTLEIIVRACDGESACGTVFYERNHAPCIEHTSTEDTDHAWLGGISASGAGAAANGSGSVF